MSRGKAVAAGGLLAAAALAVSWPRILAEYHYLKIVRQSDEANSFMALYFLGPPGEPVLMRLLRRPETVNRQLAAESLRGSRDPEVIDALMKIALEDPEEEVRLDAVSALTHIGDPRALPILEESARRDSRTIPALLAMGEGGKSALLRTVTEGSPYDRGAALATLCRRPLGLPFGRPFELDAGTREALAGALVDPNPEVRVGAAECAASTSGAAAMPGLEQMLRDEAPLVRIQAARELGRLGSQAGAQTLRVIIEDPSQPEDVRGAAARAVGDLGNKKDAAFLRALARGDPSLRVRHSAYHALQRLFPTGDPEFDTYRRGLWPTASPPAPSTSPTP